MTRKEAIEILKGLLDCSYVDSFEPEENEALQMAINSLETDEAYQLEYEKPEFCADCISRAEVLKLMKDNWHTHNGDWAMQESMDDIRVLPSVYPKSDKPLSFKEMMDRLNLTTDDIEKAEDLDFKIESLMPSYSDLIKANTQLKKQIEMLKLDRDCDKPSGKWIRQMKSEIADSLEFWDYSPNNNPLARDILETVNTYCAKMVEEKTGENNG